MASKEVMAETPIEQRIVSWTKAIFAKDIDGVMALYAPTIVSFDIDPPLHTTGPIISVGLGNKCLPYMQALSSTTYMR